MEDLCDGRVWWAGCPDGEGWHRIKSFYKGCIVYSLATAVLIGLLAVTAWRKDVKNHATQGRKATSVRTVALTLVSLSNLSRTLHSALMVDAEATGAPQWLLEIMYNLPYELLYAAYVLLCLFWVEVYQSSTGRMLHNIQRLKPVFLALVVVHSTLLIVVGLVIGLDRDMYRLFFTIFLVAWASSIAPLSAWFAVYGGKLYMKVKSNADEFGYSKQRYRILRKVMIVWIMSVAGCLVTCAWAIVHIATFQRLEEDSTYWLVIFSGYKVAEAGLSWMIAFAMGQPPQTAMNWAPKVGNAIRRFTRRMSSTLASQTSSRASPRATGTAMGVITEDEDDRVDEENGRRSSSVVPNRTDSNAPLSIIRSATTSTTTNSNNDDDNDNNSYAPVPRASFVVSDIARPYDPRTSTLESNSATTTLRMPPGIQSAQPTNATVGIQRSTPKAKGRSGSIVRQSVQPTRGTRLSLSHVELSEIVPSYRPGTGGGANTTTTTPTVDVPRTSRHVTTTSVAHSDLQAQQSVLSQATPKTFSWKFWKWTRNSATPSDSSTDLRAQHPSQPTPSFRQEEERIGTHNLSIATSEGGDGDRGDTESTGSGSVDSDAVRHAKTRFDLDRSLSASDVLKRLEEENAKLKRLIAETGQVESS